MMGPIRNWVVILSVSLMPSLVHADPPSIKAFLGSWAIAETSSQVEVLAPNALSVEVEAEADGFRLSWRDLGKSGSGGLGSDDIVARFVPSDRLGVYEYQPSSSSIITRMFASPVTGNPLEGETLIWARIDGPMLAVYSMKIDGKGGFDLDHYSWTKTDTGLQLTFVKKTEDLDSGAPIQGELVSKDD
ncbi:MAG: hypothetical protein AAGA73_04315 [Pseudomonadota bacterium]